MSEVFGDETKAKRETRYLKVYFGVGALLFLTYSIANNLQLGADQTFWMVVPPLYTFYSAQSKASYFAADNNKFGKYYNFFMQTYYWLVFPLGIYHRFFNISNPPPAWATPLTK